jgi:hypothetical protein
MRLVNRQALRALLDAEDVAHSAYSLDGAHRDECLCLVAAVGGWVAFYAEGGLRTGERLFETENEACDFMATRLLADDGSGSRMT